MSKLMKVNIVMVVVAILLWIGLIAVAQQMDGDVCTKGNCENGIGWMTCANGDKYQGSWKDGVFHGKGIYTGVDGSCYDGQYVEGVKEGRGTYYYPNGTRYLGNWKSGYRHGFGILYRGKRVIYEGYWVEDRMLLK